MSENSVVAALASAGLHDRLIVLIDYHAHARRLTLRVGTRGDGQENAERTQTLLFDGVFGLHCDPQDALAPLDDDEVGEILTVGSKERTDGAGEVTLVFRRRDRTLRREDTNVVMFCAKQARWRD